MRSITQGVQQPQQQDLGVGVIEVSNQQIDVALFPNPTNSNATLTLSKTPSEQLQLFVYDIFGRLQFQQILANEKQHNISLQNLSSGVYYISLKNKIGEYVFTAPIIKSN